MATKTSEKPAGSDAAEGEEGSKGGKAPIFVLLGGLVVGAAAGVLVVGPMIVGQPASAQSTDSQPSDGHGEPVSSVFSHAVDGLIVNPAMTSGTRILLVSLAIQVDSEDTVTELEDRDAEVRDALLTVLALKTVDELTDTSGRDALKGELLDAVRALTIQGKLLQIHIPQFVVQ